jgi:hypothetical protein
MSDLCAIQLQAAAHGQAASRQVGNIPAPRLRLWCKVAFSTQNPKIGCLKINNLRASIFLL